MRIKEECSEWVPKDCYNNPNEKKKILIAYIRKNPNCTYLDIKNNTKIKVERLYKNMGAAYRAANVKLSKSLSRRNRQQQKREIIEYIQNNPGCTVTDIQENIHVCLPRLFRTIENAYRCAGIEYVPRNIVSGVASNIIVNRCIAYERKIVDILSGLGKVRSKVRTQNGIADCTLELNGINYVVEVKDFRARNNITQTQIKQLIRYMKALKYKNGLIICPKESFPKRKNSRNITVNDFKINIMSEEDLEMIKKYGDAEIRTRI